MVLNPPGTGKDLVGDDPPYSRLFVVYNRKDPVSEQDIRDDFGQFGEIQDIFIVKDKSNGDPKGELTFLTIATTVLFEYSIHLFYSFKGVAYVKYSKMSEAAHAMESMNMQPIRNKAGVYKVYIAKK